MKLIKKIAIFLFAQSVLFFSACRTGVDDSVDLKGPTVTIISPEARENVGEKFEIRCIVTDDFAVGLVTVELDGNTWQHKGSAWQYKPKDGNNFVPYDKAEWIAENKKKVEFCIKDATIEGSGTFTIKVTAIDESGNSSEESTKSRDVIIDKDAPEITLSAPYVAQEPETFKSISDYKDITKITQFLTGDFTISGKTSEENGIQSIEVRITEYGGENELFTKRIVQDQAYKTSENDIVVDSLRSWEIPVRLAECAPLAKLDEKQHILSISTSACDTAGNESGWTRQGYACMWKEANTPWIDIILGTDASSPKYVYSGSSLLGNAYDDTAIKSVNVTIKKDGKVYGDFDKKQIYSASKDAEEENNVYFELPLPADSDDYSVEITATDNKGNVSETKKGYIKVVDKNFPSIEISHNAESGKLFFDQSGNFTLKITSQDDTKVASVKMAYIKDLADIVNYSNSNYTEWNTVSTSLNDLVNGKVLSITPKDTGKTTTDNVPRKIYENEVKINIFDHLKIDGNSRELTNQSFVFRVEDADGNALTSTYAIQGDIEAPKIEFTKIEYYSYEGAGGHVGDFKAEDGKTLPSFGEKTYVIVHGKISDNSTDILKDYEKYLALKLTANNIEIKPVVNKDNGTFTATAKNLSGASLVFEGTLTDWGGNLQIGKYSFLVDSQTPRVEYISAVNNDGYYAVGETINIFIRFNKKLEFDKNTTTSITLNNGATILYDEDITKQLIAEKKIGDNDILFQYQITSNSPEIGTLNVTAATIGDVTYSGSSVKADIINSIWEIIKTPEFGKNLGQMKNIGIIIGNPTVEGYSFNAKHDTLTITYSKNVAKGSGSVTVTQNNVSKAPAVLTETDGRTLFAQASNEGYNLEKYYELTTNGADNKFKADLTSKYVLEYGTNSDDKGLVDAYIATGRHKLTQDVRAQDVSINGNKVTVKFSSPLPCKGATYEIDIPAGFVQDENGGTKFTSEAKKYTDYEYPGVEEPVIRINRTATTVQKQDATGKKQYVATQPLSTTFKIDCETEDVDLIYRYDRYTTTPNIITGQGTDIAPGRTGSKTSKDNSNSLEDTIYKNEEIKIGDTYYNIGLEYDITVTPRKNNVLVTTATAYAVAYRTTIEITNVTLPTGERNVDQRSKPDNQNNWNYPYGENSNIVTEKSYNKNCGLFIRGGDVLVGSNITQGLPTDWDINHPDKVALMTISKESRNDENWGDDYYFTTWAIPKDYYFGFIAGLMDADTENNQGPYCGISPQNSWVSYNRLFPAPPGGYIKIDNNHLVSNKGYEWGSFIFELETKGKVIRYRYSNLISR